MTSDGNNLYAYDAEGRLCAAGLRVPGGIRGEETGGLRSVPSQVSSAAADETWGTVVACEVCVDETCATSRLSGEIGCRAESD